MEIIPYNVTCNLVPGFWTLRFIKLSCKRLQQISICYPGLRSKEAEEGTIGSTKKRGISICIQWWGTTALVIYKNTLQYKVSEVSLSGLGRTTKNSLDKLLLSGLCGFTENHQISSLLLGFCCYYSYDQVICAFQPFPFKQRMHNFFETRFADKSQITLHHPLSL